MGAGLRDTLGVSEGLGRRHDRQAVCYKDRGRPVAIDIDEAVRELNEYFGCYEADFMWLVRMSGNRRVGGRWV
jgi:hypothetical protein